MVKNGPESVGEPSDPKDGANAREPAPGERAADGQAHRRRVQDGDEKIPGAVHSRPVQSGPVQADSPGTGEWPESIAPAGKDPEIDAARERRTDWRMFRAVIALLGLVVMAAGVYYVIAGTRGLPGPQGPEDPTIESNYRYFAALMVGIGGAFVAIAIKFEWANVLWFVCAMIFIGGIGRVVSWALTGTPHVLLIVLMILELAIPPVLVVWHRWVMKTQQLKIDYGPRPSSEP